MTGEGETGVITVKLISQEKERKNSDISFLWEFDDRFKS